MANATPSPIRVAIIGGGLAGATLANALIKHSHLEIHLFESAPEFSERGAAVGLSINSQNGLGQIVSSADELLNKAGAVPMSSTRLVIGSGPDAGTLVHDLADDLAGREPGKVLHRASLLRELLAPLPKHILHANKKLTAITPRDDGRVKLTFQDGTIEDFNAVIGADGIFGTVRDHVLQDVAKEHAATAAGFWDCRCLVPFEKAKSILGAQHFEIDRQYGWLGDGVMCMHDVLENRESVQCVISAVETDPPKNRKRTLTREFLNKTLYNWQDSQIAKGMIDICLEQEGAQGYSQWEHKSTPKYANGYVCVAGDAAHATSPWQGSGAGMAIEDAMILGALFGEVSSPKKIPAAFKAFDVVRRPRCQRIIDSSRETGLLFLGKNPDVGLDPAKMKEAIAPRWNFIFGLDMESHKGEAISKFKEFL
ncbi:salicylate hydroxylase [Hypoxylon trugodes]|uniref:salicylate hydroxylase n=1 Tax=Hypoxylon trugodes TaxID=326681 RepID=UPI0021A0921D|nr:salicylate hydroxylase [Hypoxylon trugodes]KAI1394173.1 salicylate hydroxylase [Hypoxylon trugodes]